MASSIKSIPLDKLSAHPDNPNKMSKLNFIKLFRNIKQTGRYEPLVVRPYPERAGYFQIINGHHRYRVLTKLGYETADAVVWDIDDRQTDMLLATLNRLGGADRLDKKLKLLKRLTAESSAAELAKLLPQTEKQIERLIKFKPPRKPAGVAMDRFASSLVFFVNEGQKRTIEEALKLAMNRNVKPTAVKKAAAVTAMSRHYLEQAEALGAIAEVFIEDRNSNKETF